MYVYTISNICCHLCNYFRNVELPKYLQELFKGKDFELGAYKFSCPEEQLRKPTIVKVGLFQNKIPLPTWSRIQDMREAMFKMAREVLDVASKSGVNVFCFQEAWSKIYLIVFLI